MQLHCVIVSFLMVSSLCGMAGGSDWQDELPPVGAPFCFEHIARICPTNRFGVPFRAILGTNHTFNLYYNRYRIDGEDNTRYYSRREAPVPDKIIQYHVVGSVTNALVGKVYAIDLFDEGIELKQYRIGRNCAKRLEPRGKIWKGVCSQYVKRDELFQGMEVYDYYSQGEHAAIVLTYPIEKIPRQFRFGFGANRGNRGNTISLKGFDRLRFYSLRPMTFDQFVPFTNEAEIASLKEAINNHADTNLTQRMRYLSCSSVNSFVKFAQWWNDCYEALDEITSTETIDWRMDPLPRFRNIKFMWDPSNCWRMREGVSQKTSLDGRTIFFMSYGKWGAMEYFGRLLLLEDFQSYMSDFSGVVIDEEIHIINGRKVPSRLDSVPDSLLGEVIAETYDSRQKIIRWFPDCVALYENGRIRFLYCASREINTVGMWMAKWFFLMQKVMGELSPFCSVHETYIY